MRKIWVKVDPWDKKMVTTALEGGADGIMVPRGFTDKVKELGRIQTISEDGDLKTGEDVIFFTIKSGKDEEEIVKLSQNKKVILQCSDWTIIPLENLIAKGAEVIAQVNSFEDAQTAFGILEKGVNHILFHTKDPLELKKAIGNSSSALFLVHSESISNPYVSPRPFRVNAGPVHAYTRVPGDKTKYLSDLSAGDQVIIVDFKGNTTVGIVGRLKIEKRPLMLVKAVVGDKQISTILQNAETIRLTDPEGKAVSVVALKPGDEVLVAIEEGGRHFGHKIEETITEK
jgi:3-dehydroquinate synthase II